MYTDGLMSIPGYIGYRKKAWFPLILIYFSLCGYCVNIIGDVISFQFYFLLVVCILYENCWRVAVSIHTFIWIPTTRSQSKIFFQNSYWFSFFVCPSQVFIANADKYLSKKIILTNRLSKSRTLGQYGSHECHVYKYLVLMMLCKRCWAYTRPKTIWCQRIHWGLCWPEGNCDSIAF